jgi:phospholipid-transporting ATPase
MFLTFAAVLFFTMLKEAYEDLRRYRSDNELNNKATLLYDYGLNTERQVKWSDIKPGNIIRILKDEEIPADVLCIKAPKDTVFVSTMNLDGETNLKERKLPFYKDKIGDANFFGRIECEQPNANLEHWDGNIITKFLEEGI